MWCPRASITALQRLRILLISLLILYCGIWSHSSRRACLSSCTDAGCTGRDETAVCNISKVCSIGFRSGDLAGHSIQMIVACSRYWSVMRIVIHQNEIFTNSTCIWANVNIQDLVYVPESRQCAVVNDVEVRFPLSTYSRPNHDWAPAKPIMFCHTN